MRTLLLALLVGCSGAPPPQKPATSGSATVDNLHFVLEVGGSVVTPSGTTPLVATKQVHRGDELFLTLKTTRRTKLYVAYCDTAQKLAIYPPTGNLAGAPDVVVRVPEVENFVADASKGLEHIFVIATANDLDRSDPKLRDLLARAQGASGAQCATQLAMTTEESRAEATPAPVATDTRPAVAAGPRPTRVAEATKRYPSVAKVWRPRGFALKDSGEATTSSSSSDDAGIAIWAITIAHE